jgi:inorganic pyrophosphatase
VAIGERAPEVVMVYVEIVPLDTIKYELDKATGY